MLNTNSPYLSDVFQWEFLPFFLRKNGGKAIKPNEYLTDYLSREAVNALHAALGPQKAGAAARSPVFMQVCFNAPHTPLQALRSDYDDPSLSHISSHRERVYAAMIRALDRGVERIVSALTTLGELDNTLIVFTSDNGGANYIGLQDVNAPLRGWKATFFEGGVRVPFLMQWGNRIPVGSRFVGAASHVDLFPTFMSAANITLPTAAAAPPSDDSQPPVRLPIQSNLDGIDLLTRVAPPKASAAATPSLYRSKRLYWRSSKYQAIIVGHWKLQVLAFYPSRIWLHDLLDNELERHNNSLPLSEYHRLSTKFRHFSGDEQKQICSRDIPGSGLLFETVDITEDSVRAIFEAISLHMLCEESEQQEPMWPALSLSPVPIDTSLYFENVSGLPTIPDSEDVIQWAN